MEIHLFTTIDVEEKLQEVTDNLHLLNYVINGMAELYNIDDDTIIAINSLIYRALGSTKELTESRKPLALNYDPKTMYYKSSFVPEETMEL